MRYLAFAVVAFLASQSFAQIIYEPIQYQYGDQNRFYYGGSNPRIIQHGMGPKNTAQTWGRVHGYNFVSANIDTHREVSGEPDAVYTDALGYQNARYYGYTDNDARNEAYANAPTYFRKRDLLNAAVLTDHGWVVPAQAQPIRDVTIRAHAAPASRPALPRPAFIIPKQSLQPKDKIAAAPAER